jgi:hypothetical protein
MTPIKSLTQDQLTIDFPQEVYDKFQRNYEDLNEFIQPLKDLSADLSKNRNSYNINPYHSSFNKGIYILGKDDSMLGIFPNQKLALKCSQGQFGAENLRKQFYRTIQLVEDFETKLQSEEKKLLQICPVYLHLQNDQANAFFKQILFMQRIDGGVTLGQTKTGFNTEFCQVFSIPSLEEIRRKRQYSLHRYLDKNKHRQLLKIQTVYLFKRLLRKGIKICSLNQKNVMVNHVIETGQTKYIIIDPIEDLFPPLSPLYNGLTMKLCT